MTGSSILVAGFHRSGTSAVAQVLQRAGLDLGNNLLGAEPSNPYGHFEDLDVIASHDAALAAHGLTWKDTTTCPRPAGRLAEDIATFVERRNATTPVGSTWGVKDPRLCLFLPEWLAATPNAHVVVVVRQPGAAITSLHRRHARRYVDTRQADPTDLAFWQDPDLGLRLWIHYHEQLLTALPENAIVVDFDDRPTIEHLPQVLHDHWDVELETSTEVALDPNLGTRQSEPVEVRDVALIREAESVWGKLPIRPAPLKKSPS